MALGPDIIETLARARSDLRMGVPVVIAGSAPVLVVAAETLSPARLDRMRALGHDPVLAITTWRAETLKARAYDGDLARIEVGAEMGLATLQALADPKDDLATPMKGPLMTARDGDASGHRAAIQLCKAARLLPAAFCVTVDIAAVSGLGLTGVDLAAAQGQRAGRSPLHPVVQARLPLEVSEAGRLHVFRPEDGGEEHYAVEIGRPDRSQPVLSRLHSACFTGDLMGSLKCDCGPQLRGALRQMGEECAGVLLFLNQ